MKETDPSSFSIQSTHDTVVGAFKWCIPVHACVQVHARIWPFLSFPLTPCHGSEPISRATTTIQGMKSDWLTMLNCYLFLASFVQVNLCRNTQALQPNKYVIIIVTIGLQETNPTGLIITNNLILEWTISQGR